MPPAKAPAAKAPPAKAAKECPHGGPQPVEQHVLGNERALGVLREAARGGNPPQTWLFSGPESVGKRTAAWWFVRLLLCEAQDFEARPCEECQTCTWLLHSSVTGGCRGRELPEKWCDPCRERGTASPHPHVRELEVEPGKTLISVEQVRDMQEWGEFPPLGGEDRVAVVDEGELAYGGESGVGSRVLHKVVVVPQAHRLNGNSQNALLKTLEEPPPHLIFILITPTHTALLPTIVSRSTLVRFSPVVERDIAEWVRRFADVDRIDLSAVLSEGSPGVALSCAREAGGKGRRSKGYWGLRDSVLDVAASLPRMDGFDVVEKAEDLLPTAARARSDGPAGEVKLLAAERVIDILATWFRDLLLLTEGLDGRRSLLNQDHIDDLRASATAWTSEGIMGALDALREYRLMIRGNVNQKLLFPRMLLRLRPPRRR